MIRDTRGQDQVITVKPKRKKYVLLAFAVTLLVSVLSKALIEGSRASLSIEKDSVQFARVQQGELIRDVSATGRIVAANAPQVYSPEQGFVTLQVKAGDKVSYGQVVASVFSPELTNKLKQQESELQRLKGELARQELASRRQTLSLSKTFDLAQVELDAAKRENRRAQLSIEKNLISQIELEKAVDDLAKAELIFKHAQQEVLLAQDTVSFELQSAKSRFERQLLVIDDLNRQVNNLSVKASVTGIVGNLLVQPKSAVSQNQALMTLVDLSAFEAQLQVPESYANELGLGMQVELKLANKTVLGQLSAISPEVSDREVTTRVRFEQTNLTGIRQNQRLTARILLESKSDVLLLKRGAFLQSGGFFAYKVKGDVASKVDITTGAISINAIEVLTGLQEGEQIIISSYQEFKQAQTILLR